MLASNDEINADNGRWMAMDNGQCGTDGQTAQDGSSRSGWESGRRLATKNNVGMASSFTSTLEDPQVEMWSMEDAAGHIDDMDIRCERFRRRIANRATKF